MTMDMLEARSGERDYALGRLIMPVSMPSPGLVASVGKVWLLAPLADLVIVARTVRARLKPSIERESRA